MNIAPRIKGARSNLGGVLKSCATQLSDEQIGKKFGLPNVGARSHFVL
jgi:hypothetical protein